MTNREYCRSAIAIHLTMANTSFTAIAHFQWFPSESNRKISHSSDNE